MGPGRYNSRTPQLAKRNVAHLEADHMLNMWHSHSPGLPLGRWMGVVDQAKEAHPRARCKILEACWRDCLLHRAPCPLFNIIKKKGCERRMCHPSSRSIAKTLVFAGRTRNPESPNLPECARMCPNVPECATNVLPNVPFLKHKWNSHAAVEAMR